jgi:hypothetical protein
MVGSLLHTLNGSAYEFDVRGRLVRRLGNHRGHPPTHNLCRDGDWRRLESIALHPSPDGIRVQILWESGGIDVRSTLLSAVLDPRALESLLPLFAYF